MKNILNKINHNSGIPLHRQIEEVLRELINSGEFDKGKLFPNEVELSTIFGVSRNTVRQAFKSLVHEGLLTRKQGVGTTVKREQNIVTHLKKWYSFTKDMKAQGIQVKNYIITLSTVSCNRELADVFNLEQGRKIKKLLRVRGNKSVPFVVFESWFHPRIPIQDDQDFSGPLNEILEDRYNVIAVKSDEELRATIADKRISKLLGVAPGSPIFFRKRMVFDAGMRIIEFNKCYYRHDKMTYKIEINRTME